MEKQKSSARISKHRKDTFVYDPNIIEAKWSEIWVENGTFSPNIKEAPKPYYNLMMFPYPSAEGLHVGNMYAQTGADVHGRFKRMQGFNVFEPMGLDGFGIHSENYALKVGTHPMTQAEKSEQNFYRQMHAIGTSVDWRRTVETYEPSYYKWTQWLFTEMFRSGLAYRKKEAVNWCPSCKTVLSDEQVIAGECERCGSVVEKRQLEQWFFRITEYAQKLLNNLDTLDWTERVKIAQRNWIGRSEGARIKFAISGSQFLNPHEIEVFTTRPDTLHGATFLVISPEHPIVSALINTEGDKTSHFEEIKRYVKKASAKTEAERVEEDKEKTGVFSGLYAVNPVSGEEIPVWIADYVLMGYGTGAIMAVPAHDSRDFEFARRYKLPIKRVIKDTFNVESEDMAEAFSGDGVLVNSGVWNGWQMPKEIDKVFDFIKKGGFGAKTVNYHLRDWLISRQRYWGPPIPMIFCPNCAERGISWFSRNKKKEPADWNAAGWFPVSVKDLPVVLPYIKDYRPVGTGKAPLANHPEFYKTVCPECSGPATRETDVSDTFLDSAWYFLRYPSTDIDSTAFDIDVTKKWLPVNIYIGGAEHAVLHLLYARFVTMALHDLKLIDFEEPFAKFFAHGLIIKDGAKMSKSRGNVVVPDQYITKYGADTLRMYLMFLGAFHQGGDFRDSGIEGMSRFLRRIWKLFHTLKFVNGEEEDVLRMLNKTIFEVSKDISELSYNTAIARLMEFYNFISVKKTLAKSTAVDYLKLFAPFAPFMTEEIYQQIMESDSASYQSIHLSSWPEYDEKYIKADSYIVVIQENGKRRGEITISSDELHSKKLIEDKALSELSQRINKDEVKKVIYVPGKIINFVV